MRTSAKTILATALGAGVLAFMSAGASAAVVCSGNTCWHSHERYEFPPSARVVIHDDDWKWKRHEHYRWREHEGHGYWRGGVWIDLH